MIELYFVPGSAAFAVHLVLEEAGAEYRLVRVTRDGGQVEPAEFARLSPNGRVPLFVEGDLVLTESAAIVMHLSDRYAEAALAPAVGTSERAHWYRWLAFLTNTVQPAFIAFIYPARVTADADAGKAVRRDAEASLGAIREYLAGHLAANGPFLLGERFTSADHFLFMLTRWGRRLESRWWDDPVLGGHFERVWLRPAVQRAWEQEGLDPWR